MRSSIATSRSTTAQSYVGSRWSLGAPPGRTCQSLQTRMSSWLSARKRWYERSTAAAVSPAGTRAHVVCAARPSGVIRRPLGDRAANPTSTMRTATTSSPSARRRRAAAPRAAAASLRRRARRALRHRIHGDAAATSSLRQAAWLQCRRWQTWRGERRCSTRRRCAARGACCARPTTCSTLMDTSAEGVVACVADAGATFLAPIFDELTAVVCLSGTPQSHIGIVSREYQVPCVMARGVRRRRTRRRRRRRGRLLGRHRRRAAGVVSDLDATERVNREIRYHSEISLVLTEQRTALESALIPVTAYILVACVECYRRYPEMIEAITAVASPEDLGRAGHRFATQIDNVHLWAVPNFPLVGSQGARDGRDDRPRRRPASTGDRVRLLGPRRARVPLRRRHPSSVGRRRRRHAVPRTAAGDCSRSAGRSPATSWRGSRGSTRCSRRTSSCCGSTPGRATRTPARTDSTTAGSLLLRAFNGSGPSHFPWSAEVGQDLPYRDVLGAFVLDGVDLRVTDFGTSVTAPEDYLHARRRGRASST